MIGQSLGGLICAIPLLRRNNSITISMGREQLRVYGRISSVGQRWGFGCHEGAIAERPFTALSTMVRVAGVLTNRLQNSVHSFYYVNMHNWTHPEPHLVTFHVTPTQFLIQ